MVHEINFTVLCLVDKVGYNAEVVLGVGVAGPGNVNEVTPYGWPC